MYLYETHLHTSPVSRCALWSVREAVEYYKNAGYAGIFVTNHFIDGNIAFPKDAAYEDKINFYFSDAEEAIRIGKEIGIDVFTGVEMSNWGTDFLIYGLDKEWYLAHPEIYTMNKRELLQMIMEAGALVIQAHPFREAGYIDHIRLYPRSVHGVEIDNANRTAFENEMAKQYAENYGLLTFAGSDNHGEIEQVEFAGMQSETPVVDELDFVKKVLGGEMTTFHKNMEPFCREK
jgi:hypothetical protein